MLRKKHYLFVYKKNSSVYIKGCNMAKDSRGNFKKPSLSRSLTGSESR